MPHLSKSSKTLQLALRATPISRASEIAQALDALEDVKPCGRGFKACCPAHEDDRASLLRI